MEKRDLDIICRGISNWNMYRNSTILVTGATGRLGRYIVETLVDVDLKYNLNLRVLGLARNMSKIESVFGNLLEFPNVKFITQDINEGINYDSEVNYIFHTAGPAAPLDFKKSSVNTLWAHVNGTHNVLEFAVKKNCRRVFYVSTVETYGDWESQKLIREDDMGPLHHFNARACYPEAKRICETMLTCYKATYGIDFCGVRLCHTLGPGILLDDGRAFAEFLDNSIHGRNIILRSDGSAMRTYTYTSDAVNAMFLVMERGTSGEMYNVANCDNLISIKDLASLIARLSPYKDVKVEYSPEANGLPYLPYHLPIMDTTKISELGWEPETNLEDMFRWTIQSLI